MDFIRAMEREKIRYLLIGRQALVILGAPLVTQDYDFCLSPEPETLDRLLSLVRKNDLEVSPRNPRKKPFFSLLSDSVKLDYFRARSYSTSEGERFTFEEIYGRKKTFRLEDFEIHLPSIEDLIRLKKVRSSPRDQEDIKYLQVLLERERDKKQEKRFHQALEEGNRKYGKMLKRLADS